jgi:hypothetical protein
MDTVPNAALVGCGSPASEKPDPSVLRAAPMAELLHRPISEEAQSLTETLLGITLGSEGPRQRKRPTKIMENLRATIAALVRDLLSAAACTASEGFCFRPEGSPDFTGTLATARQYETVRDTWIKEGLIERVSGARHGLEFDGAYARVTGRLAGWAPRLRATPTLLTIAAGHGITPETLGDHFERSFDLSYPVFLRRKVEGTSSHGPKAGGKGAVRFPRTAEANRIAAEVNALNAYLEAQTYDPPFAPYFAAVFGEDPTRPGELSWGGRLQTSGTNHFQGWSPKARLALKINGEAVVEIDIKASHPTIYLAHQGVFLPQGADPYEVPGIHRLVVKRLVTAFFGNGHPHRRQWPQKLAAEYKAKTGRVLTRDFKLQDTVSRIVKALPALGRLSFSGLGSGELQRIEAGILRATISALREAGIPALPVHDSIVVPETQVDTAARVLAEEFYKETKATPSLVVNHLNRRSVL